MDNDAVPNLEPRGPSTGTMSGSHRCIVCWRSFAWPEHLEIHNRSHHQEFFYETHECPECMARFPLKDILWRHQQQCHSVTSPKSKNNDSIWDQPSPSTSKPAPVESLSLDDGLDQTQFPGFTFVFDPMQHGDALHEPNSDVHVAANRPNYSNSFGVEYDPFRMSRSWKTSGQSELYQGAVRSSKSSVHSGSQASVSASSAASDASMASNVSSRRGRLSELARAGMKALKGIGACWRCKFLRKPVSTGPAVR